MTHCTLQATIKPTRFQFTPKTVICNAFLMMMMMNECTLTWRKS